MFSKKSAESLLTYNFDLERLLLTTHDSTTSNALDQAEYGSNLVLTLRQYRGTLAGRAKGFDIGYLFILHSGIHAIERIDLKKIREAASGNSTATYKISCGRATIDFQYPYNQNFRTASIVFRKQNDYDQAVEILLSQKLAMTISRDERIAMPAASLMPSSQQRLHASLGQTRHSVPERALTDSSGQWNEYNPQTAYSQAPLSEPWRNSQSTASVGTAVPNTSMVHQHHQQAHTSYYEPNEVQSISPHFSQNDRGRSQGSEASRVSFHDHLPLRPTHFAGDLSEMPIDPRITRSASFSQSPSQESIGIASSCSTRTLRGHPIPSPLQQVTYPEDSVTHNFARATMGERSTTTQGIDSYLPPRRDLPFKPSGGVTKSKARRSPRLARSDREAGERQQPTLGTSLSSGHGETGPGLKASATRDISCQTDLQPSSPRIKAKKRKPPAMKDAACQTDAPRGPVADQDNQTPNPQKTKVAELLSNLQEQQVQLKNAFLTLRAELQRPQATSVSATAAATLRHQGEIPLGPSASTRSKTLAEALGASIPPFSDDPTGTFGAPRRRHTKEYKEWRYYYLHFCRVYETKKERSDSKFIQRFLHEMPSGLLRNWIQDGLLECYPGMTKMSNTRQGSSFVYTRDLTWNHVREMATKKLRLPFSKWETT